MVRITTCRCGETIEVDTASNDERCSKCKEYDESKGRTLKRVIK